MKTYVNMIYISINSNFQTLVVIGHNFIIERIIKLV